MLQAVGAPGLVLVLHAVKCVVDAAFEFEFCLCVPEPAARFYMLAFDHPVECRDENPDDDENDQRECERVAVSGAEIGHLLNHRFGGNLRFCGEPGVYLLYAVHGERFHAALDGRLAQFRARSPLVDHFADFL